MSYKADVSAVKSGIGDEARNERMGSRDQQSAQTGELVHTAQRLDFGRQCYELPIPGKTYGVWRIDARALWVSVAVWIAIIVLGIFALFTGSASVTPTETWNAVLGRGDSFTTMIVVEWRAPRIIIAVLLGASLAVSGSIFQTLTNNALGSPDVIGFQTGSYTGALFIMLVVGGSSISVMIGALVGGIMTALVVFFLSVRNGNTRGVRLVIVGIGVSAMLASLNTWMLLTATVEDALMASLWGAGNLSGATWFDVWLIGCGAIIFGIGAVCLLRPMRIMQIGIPFATALGLHVHRVQLLAIMVGIGLIAIATSTVGPIAFIALAAPHIARRVVRLDGLVLGTSAAVGALLLLLADVIAQRIYPDSPLPVGIVTVSIGGIYFLWLLFREGKAR